MTPRTSSRRFGPIGESAGVAERFRSGQTDIDVDQDVAKPRRRGAVDPFIGVNSDGDESVDVGKAL